MTQRLIVGAGTVLAMFFSGDVNMALGKVCYSVVWGSKDKNIDHLS